jgi:hypothetical protein
VWSIALRHIADCCKEQWRPGKTQSVSFGNATATNVPYMQRETTATELYRTYIQKKDAQGKIEGYRPLGRDSFTKLVKAVTRMVEEKACLSYFYTDMLVAFDHLLGISNRLVTLCAEETANLPHELKQELMDVPITLADLPQLVESVKAFTKYELYQHVTTDPKQCNGCSIHCAAHAVNAPCSSVSHSPKCEECMSFRYLPRLVKQVQNSLWVALCRKVETSAGADITATKAAIEEILTMPQALAYIESAFSLFQQHVTRGEWQAAHVEKVLASVTNKKVVAHFDHRMKQTLRKLNESSVEHYGQSGESVLGICVYYRRGSVGDCPVETKFVDYVVDDNRQNPQQVQSILDSFMRDDLCQLVPTAEEVVFLSDNGSAFGTFDHCPWIVQRNSMNWHRPCADAETPQPSVSAVAETQPSTSSPPTAAMASVPTNSTTSTSPPTGQVRVVRMLFFEAQRGKGIVDCHFAFLGKQVRRAVKLGMVVGPPSSIYEAFILNGGIMNTMTVLLTVNAAEKRLRCSPGATKELGIRRVHDILFDGSRCTAYMQTCSSIHCSFDVAKAAEKILAPTCKKERSFMAASSGQVRLASRNQAAGIAVSHEFKDEKPFSQHLITAVVSFAEGKSVLQRVAIPNISGLSEPLIMEGGIGEVSDDEAQLEEVEDEDVGKAKTGKAKALKERKVNGVLLPDVVSILRYEQLWAWKRNRKRPGLKDHHRARIKEMVNFISALRIVQADSLKV